MPATCPRRGDGGRSGACLTEGQAGNWPGKQKRRREAPFCMQLEAEVGIEPAYTALQAAA